MALIEARTLVKTYRMGDQVVQALDGVSLDIDEGEFVKLYTLAATETSADEAVLRERFREQVAG